VPFSFCRYFLFSVLSILSPLWSISPYALIFFSNLKFPHSHSFVVNPHSCMDLATSIWPADMMGDQFKKLTSFPICFIRTCVLFWQNSCWGIFENNCSLGTGIWLNWLVSWRRAMTRIAMKKCKKNPQSSKKLYIIFLRCSNNKKPGT
jgi:hypothetical protein